MRNTLWLMALLVTACIPTNAQAQWYGSTDFLLPSRSVPSDRSFQHNVVSTTSGSTTTRTVGSDNLLSVDLGSVAAGRATLGYQGGYFGIEGGFLATDTWTSRASIFDSNGLLASPFTGIGEPVNSSFDLNTTASIGYQTRLQSAELNLTYLMYDETDCQATCKFGIRGMWIDEQFNYFSDNGTTQNNWTMDVQNEMLGPQIGLRGYTAAPGGRVGLNCLGGYAYNQIDRAQVLNTAGNSFDTSEGTLFGELGVEYVLMPTPNLAIRIGFQFFGLSNVGLALDNPRVDNDQTDDVWYYMPYLGIGGSF